MSIKFSETDPKLKNLIQKKDLSYSRIRDYDVAFREIYDLTGYTPTRIIEIAKQEQKPSINNGIVEFIDIDDRQISKIQDQLYEYLKKKKINGRPVMKRTMLTKFSAYRAFLKFYKIELPEKIKITIPKQRLRDKDIPTWNDVKDAINLCKSPRDSSIIAFAVTTGLRISDIVNLKLEDLIEACEIYFDENEEKTIDTLLNKNPDDIVPCWEMNPQKTGQKDTPNLTITFNTPEASRYIWFYLKDRFNREKKKDKNYVVDLSEPLFKSQRGGHLSPVSVETHFRNLNARLGGKKDKNGIYIKFRLHNLRKLFKTTCRRNISSIHVQSDKTYDGDVISLFTGHATPNNPLSYTYEAVEDDSHDSHIRMVYQALIPYLSIQPTELKHVETKQYKDLKEQNEELKKQLDEQNALMQREMDEQREYYLNQIEQLENDNEQRDLRYESLERKVLQLFANQENIKVIQDYIKDNELVNHCNLGNKVLELYISDIEDNPTKLVTHQDIDKLVTRAFDDLPEKDKKGYYEEFLSK